MPLDLTPPSQSILLSEDQFDFEKMVSYSAVLDAVEPIKMERSRVEVPSRVDKDKQVVLTSVSVLLPYELKDEDLEEAYKNGDESLRQHVLRELYTLNAIDLEDLFINGDDCSIDSLYRAGNGLLKNLKDKAREITLGYESFLAFARFIEEENLTLLHNHSLEVIKSHPKSIIVDRLDQNIAIFIDLDNVYAGYGNNITFRRTTGAVDTSRWYAVKYRVALEVMNPEKAIIVNLFKENE